MDDLKAKLAAQEVDLKQKNADADKLIQVVGIETDKASREKAVADKEAQKVALLTLEVKQKQEDCEEDLAKAEPALTAAQAALSTLSKVGAASACLPIPRGRSRLSCDPKTTCYPPVPKRYKGKVGRAWLGPAVTGLFIKQINIYLS